MSTILDKIIVQTRKHVERCKRKVPESILRIEAKTIPSRFSFREVLAANDLAIIAEIKKASPSKGMICKSFDPVSIAKTYRHGGAAAVSVLTDETFFHGNIRYLDDVAAQIELPLLRKDFIIDPYQIYEAKCHYASAVLLLAGPLDGDELTEYLQLTHELGMHALVEVHNEFELNKALKAGAGIIGVNNRDLKTFHVDLNTSLRLVDRIPDSVLCVSESGIHSRTDIVRLWHAGYHACLIGESLMRHPDAACYLKQLRGQ